MNRVEAVERGIRAYLETIGEKFPWPVTEVPRLLQLGMEAALDASGYPAALAEAIEILRREGHRPVGQAGHIKLDCVFDGAPWPCRTARFLAEHDETT